MEDWENVKHVLKYFKGTTDYNKLNYCKKGEKVQILLMINYNITEASVYIIGYVAIFASVTIDWRSHKQNCAATLFTHSEYMVRCMY